MLTASGAPSGWRVVDIPERGTTYAYVGPSPTASAETVVLLHGWTATGASNWAATIAALEERYRVVALDHRGHGRGIRGTDPFSLEDCADDVVALLDGLGVRSAIFVGYSMGGPIAQLIWRRHPRVVHGLILLATAADFTSTPGYEPLEDIVEHVWKASGLIRQSLQPVTKHVSELLVAAPIGLEMLGLMASHDDDAIHDAGRAIRQFCSTAWIADIDVPVVVIVTKRDRVVDPSRQRQLAALIPRSRAITLDAGHVVPFTQPELIARAVASACDSIDPPSVVTRLRRFARTVGRRVRRRRQRVSLGRPSHLS